MTLCGPHVRSRRILASLNDSRAEINVGTYMYVCVWAQDLVTHHSASISSSAGLYLPGMYVPQPNDRKSNLPECGTYGTYIRTYYAGFSDTTLAEINTEPALYSSVYTQSSQSDLRRRAVWHRTFLSANIENGRSVLYLLP
jgi:hypothetical protein